MQLHQLRRTIERCRTPILLDLYCGSGGAAMGYWQAGFMVIGVDHVAQREYPFPFYMADALEFLDWAGDVFDCYHASPPCQTHSITKRRVPPRNRTHHVDWLPETRKRFQALGAGVPWVIENVVGAPLESPIVLCGTMFGLNTYRHRLFESNIQLQLPDAPHLSHRWKSARLGQRAKAHEFGQYVGNFPGVREAQDDLGAYWMTRSGIAQCIPPAYTHHIGRQLWPTAVTNMEGRLATLTT